MFECLTEETQVSILKALGERVYDETHLQTWVVLRIGDVPTLQIEAQEGWEIVCATGVFDLWSEGQPIVFGLDENGIVEHIKGVAR